MAETVASILLAQLGQHPAFTAPIWTAGGLLGRRPPAKQLENFELMLCDAVYSDQHNVHCALVMRPCWRESLDVRIDALRAAEGIPGLTDDAGDSIPHLPLHEYAQSCCDLGMSQLQAILPLIEKGLYWSMIKDRLCVSKLGAKRQLQMYAMISQSTH